MIIKRKLYSNTDTVTDSNGNIDKKADDKDFEDKIKKKLKISNVSTYIVQPVVDGGLGALGGTLGSIAYGVSKNLPDKKLLK